MAFTETPPSPLFPKVMEIDEITRLPRPTLPFEAFCHLLSCELDLSESIMANMKYDSKGISVSFYSGGYFNNNIRTTR